jgi:PhnB protein
MTHSDVVRAIPYLTCRDADGAIAFYGRAFGAVELSRIPDDAGRVSHAEISVGGAAIYISDEYPEHDAHSPQTVGGTATMVVLIVPDADSLFDQAVADGAAVMRPLQDRFDGAARNGKLRDPYGHHWMIFTQR